MIDAERQTWAADEIDEPVICPYVYHFVSMLSSLKLLMHLGAEINWLGFFDEKVKGQGPGIIR